MAEIWFATTVGAWTHGMEGPQEPSEPDRSWSPLLIRCSHDVPQGWLNRCENRRRVCVNVWHERDDAAGRTVCRIGPIVADACPARANACADGRWQMVGGGDDHGPVTSRERRIVRRARRTGQIRRR